MATILDIFRTQAGDTLIERTNITTGIDPDKLHKFFSAFFPLILSVSEEQNFHANKISTELLTFLKDDDLLVQSKKISENWNHENIDQASAKISELFGIQESNRVKLYEISFSFINILVNEIQSKNSTLKISEIIQTLLGKTQVAVQEFIDCIVKDSKEANLIDNPNRISLGEKNDDSDQSILGGYTGGR